jgi:hypothetical protein
MRSVCHARVSTNAAGATSVRSRVSNLGSNGSSVTRAQKRTW